MKEIIPLKKDVIFKTIIGEICNISLDYDYKIENDLVNGSVDISGSYKMTEASVLEEDFFYSVPFSISISKNIKKDTINIEIDDFKYNINKDILSLSIDLCLNCEEDNIYKEDNMEIDNSVDEYFNDVDLMNLKSDSNDTINEKIGNENFNFEITDNTINKNLNMNNNEVNTNIDDITNNLSDNKYYTYKVYIVRNGDTIDSICNKYNVNINDLKDYNDIDNINIGQKIIIPQINE